ncbi:MAG: MFS transporter, partial [Dehalococcoidia bacterium]
MASGDPDRAQSRVAKNMISLLPLYVLGFSSFISFTLLFPVMPQYATEFGASVFQVGLVVGIYSYITALAMIPFGMLSDRIGRRVPLIVGLIALSLSPLLYLLVSDVPTLILVRAVHGLAAAAFIPVAHALVADMAPPHKMGEAMGWYTGSVQLSFVVGPMAGGFLLNYFGFNAVFYACSAVPFLGLLFILPRLRAIPRRPAMAEAVASPWGWLRQRRALGGLLTPFFITLGSGTIIAFMPLYGAGFGIETGRVGIIIAVIYASSVLLRAPAGRLSDRIGRTPLILSGLLISAVALVYMSFAASFPWLMVAGVFFGLGMGLAIPAGFALVADLSPVGERGLTMGTANSFLQLGVAAGATAMGGVAGATGLGTMFKISALILIVGLFLIFYLT